MTHKQVMHAARVGGAGHTQLAPGVGTEHIGKQLAALDKGFGIGRQTVTIEGGTAQRARDMRAFVDLQPLGKQLLTQGVFKER